MEITEIRHRNFLELRKIFRAREAAEGIIEIGDLERFSTRVGVSSGYLSHINTARKNIGHALARKLEVAFKLPMGWVDLDHLSGAVAMDENEREFGALALRIYRKNPDDARQMITRYLASVVLGDDLGVSDEVKKERKVSDKVR